MRLWTISIKYLLYIIFVCRLNDVYSSDSEGNPNPLSQSEETETTHLTYSSENSTILSNGLKEFKFEEVESHHLSCKLESNHVSLDLKTKASTDKFVIDEADGFVTFTRKEEFVFNKVTFKNQVVWESSDQYVKRVVLKTFDDVPSFVSLLLVSGKAVLLYYDDHSWVNITNTRYTMSDLTLYFDGNNKFNKDSLSLEKFNHVYTFSQGANCYRVKFKDKCVWFYQPGKTDGYPHALIHNLLTNNFFLKFENEYIKLQSKGLWLTSTDMAPMRYLRINPKEEKDGNDLKFLLRKLHFNLYQLVGVATNVSDQNELPDPTNLVDHLKDTMKLIRYLKNDEDEDEDVELPDVVYDGVLGNFASKVQLELFPLVKQFVEDDKTHFTASKNVLNQLKVTLRLLDKYIKGELSNEVFEPEDDELDEVEDEETEEVDQSSEGTEETDPSTSATVVGEDDQGGSGEEDDKGESGEGATGGSEPQLSEGTFTTTTTAPDGTPQTTGEAGEGTRTANENGQDSGSASTQPSTVTPPTDFKLFSNNDELTPDNYTLTKDNNDDFVYEFKDGVNLTEVKYKNESVWKYQSGNHPKKLLYSEEYKVFKLKLGGSSDQDPIIKLKDDQDTTSSATTDQVDGSVTTTVETPDADSTTKTPDQLQDGTESTDADATSTLTQKSESSESTTVSTSPPPTSVSTVSEDVTGEDQQQEEQDHHQQEGQGTKEGDQSTLTAGHDQSSKGTLPTGVTTAKDSENRSSTLVTSENQEEDKKEEGQSGSLSEPTAIKTPSESGEPKKVTETKEAKSESTPASSTTLTTPTSGQPSESSQQKTPVESTESTQPTGTGQPSGLSSGTGASTPSTPTENRTKIELDVSQKKGGTGYDYKEDRTLHVFTAKSTHCFNKVKTGSDEIWTASGDECAIRVLHVRDGKSAVVVFSDDNFKRFLKDDNNKWTETQDRGPVCINFRGVNSTTLIKREEQNEVVTCTAMNGYGFSRVGPVIVSDYKVIWKATNASEYATKLVYDKNHKTVKIFLPNNVTKDFEFKNNEWTEKQKLDIKKKESNDPVDYNVDGNAHKYIPKLLYGFNLVKHGNDVIYETSNPSEYSDKVVYDENKNSVSLTFADGESKSLKRGSNDKWA